MKTNKPNQPSNTVYLSNLSYKRDRAGVKSLLSRYGTIKNIKIIVEPQTLESKGMAFAEMGSIEEATKAIKGLTGAVIDGRNIKANYAKPFVSELKKNLQDKLQDKHPDYNTKQLAKKARNDAKRKSNPLVYKTSAKKVITPK